MPAWGYSLPLQPYPRRATTCGDAAMNELPAVLTIRAQQEERADRCSAARLPSFESSAGAVLQKPLPAAVRDQDRTRDPAPTTSNASEQLVGQAGWPDR